MADSLIDRYRHRRAQAVRIGDKAVVAEIDLHLRRYGATVEPSVAEPAAEATAEAEVKPRRGRPPIHRDAA